MTELSRRDFLIRSGLASASLLLPRFLKAFQTQGNTFLPEGNKRLVVIQMSGGNDGLNTVIPYRNDDYYSLRPNLAIPKSDVLTLTDELGLNPMLKSLKDFYEQGSLSVINNVGYPNPDRSHFRSMDIWQSASGSDKYISSGWLGRYLDSECADCKSYYAIEADDTLSLAMKGELHKGLAVKNPDQLYADSQRRLFRDVNSDYSAQHLDNPLDYLYKTQAETLSSADYIHDKFKTYKSASDYPQDDFGRNMKTIAELIISGMETKIYYVSIGSFDTHVAQKGKQEKLFGQLSDALAAFVKDLQQNNCFKDTLIMTFSEFGRRVKENASNGTDHGTANNMFLISGSLAKPGIYNEPANLSDLDQGDLKYHIDFRSVYATVLSHWLKANDAKILGSKYDYLSLI